MARGVPSRERAHVLGTGNPVTDFALPRHAGLCRGGHFISLANRGNTMVQFKCKKPKDGDEVRNPSRHVPRRGEKWSAECRLATLNVQGGMDGKMNEVCQVMEERHIDVLCVNETKKKGCGSTRNGPFTAYWSGVPSAERGSRGVGIILSDRMSACVNDFEYVNPRLLWLKLKVGLTRLLILGAYAPVDDPSNASPENEEFWDSVRDVLIKCKNNERIIMLGDFNGWVGVKRDGYETVLGMYGDERVNENGKNLLDICLEWNLCVTNTMFCHKKIHMYTWQRGNVRSMIDFVIMDERLKRRVVDTRTFRGISVGTDHFLVVSRVVGLFTKWRHRPPTSTTQLIRVKVQNLQDPDVKGKYENCLNEKFCNFEYLKEVESVEELWKIVKTGIIDSATEVCGVSKRRKGRKEKDEWWDEEVKGLVKEKKNAWLDILSLESNQRITGRYANERNEQVKEKYKQLKRKVKEVVERKKKELKEKYDRRFCKDFQNNIKLFWTRVKAARGKSISSELCMIRDGNGKILNGGDDIMRRWKEYFGSLFEKEVAGVESPPSDLQHPASDECEIEISMQEIMDALKSMKSGKAAGFDGIPTEMLRNGGGTVASLLYLLFNLCLSSGQVPVDWTKAVIVPLYKGKGSKQDCKNYRGISLLSVVGKLYAKVLIERVMKETDNKIWDVQAGFRRGMGCVDQVFTLRQITEKCLAKCQKVFCAFVDLEKAYDRVRRYDLWSTLNMYGVSSSLIQALKSLYRDSSACVRINGSYTDWFHIQRGVRQGCVASPWLFNLFMDSCLAGLKESEWGLRMDGLLIKCLLYADDQILIASSAVELQEMVNTMNDSLKMRGMNMNVSKTKVMVFEREECMTNCEIVVGSERLEQVREFVYLGCMFTRDGRHEGDIERRVNAGNRVNGALHAFMGSQIVSNEARLAVHNSVLVPTLMYGSESWVWQKKNESRINAVEMRALRSMCGVTLKDRIRNNVIRERCGVKEDIITKVEKGMLRWFGHMERMNERRLTKKAYVTRVEGSAGRGRPRRTFLDQIGDVLKKGHVKSSRNRRSCIKRLMNVEEAREVCRDRSKWRSVVSAYPCGT